MGWKAIVRRSAKVLGLTGCFTRARSHLINGFHATDSIVSNSEMEKELDDYAAQFISAEDKEQLPQIRAQRQHVKKRIVIAARNACEFSSSLPTPLTKNHHPHAQTL
jgi:hypothetical protein